MQKITQKEYKKEFKEIKDYFISLINIAESDNSYINFGNLFIHGIKNFI